MSSPLHRTGARGGGVTLTGQAIRMVIQMAGVVILSRVLEPTDFGLIAMVTVFMTLADLLRDFGMPSAALQAKSLSQQQASNMFWLSALLGAIGSALLALSTPFLVQLYGEPKLAQVVPALSLTLLVGGFQAQIQVQLARQLRFTTLAVSAMIAPAAGLATAVVAAIGGLGYWALVLQALTIPVVLAAIQSLAVRWRPSLPRRGHDTRRLFTSGAHLGMAYLLTWAASNVDTLVAGARWGAVGLGYYNRGFQVTAAPIGSFLSPLTQVAIPLLNRLEEQGRKPAHLLLQLQFILAAPISTVMAAIALTAPSLIPMMLGPGWEATIPVVQVLALGECFHALSFVSYWGFLVTGQSKQLLRYNLVSKPLSVACVLVGSTYGVTGIAWGYAAGLAISWPINLLWLSRSAGFPGLSFWWGGVRILLVTLTATAVLYIPFATLATGPSAVAIIAGLLGVPIVSLLIHALFRSGRADLARGWRLVRNLR